jgi:hypothetical protein
MSKKVHNIRNVPKKSHTTEGKFLPVPKGSKPLTKEQIEAGFRELEARRKPVKVE